MKSAYNEWEQRNIKEMKFWFSPTGEELQRCLVAQGYYEILFWKFAVFFGSEWTAASLINKLKKEIEE